MAGRPPLGLGTAGKIRATRTSSGWRADVMFRDMDGRTRRIERNAETKAKAIQALKDACRDRQHRAGADLSRDHTFAQAGERWLAEVKRKRPGSTYDRYAGRLHNSIVPALGQLRLCEITVGMMDRYIESLESRLKPNTVRGYRTVLSGVMGYAVRMDAISINPVRAVSPIEGKGKESRGLTAAERVDLLAKLDADERAVADDLPDLLRYMIGTGVRVAEAMALRWFRVDLDEGVVVHGDNLSRVLRRCQTCDRTRRKHRDGECTWFPPPPGTAGLVLVQPKTEAGFRVLPLPDFVLMVLRMRYPGPEAALAPVFPRSTTAPARSSGLAPFGQVHPIRPVARVDAWRDPNNTTRSIRKFRDKVGYPWFTSHVCRHTAATIMDEQGLTPREMAGYLGHARPSFTQDHYMDRRQQSGLVPRALDRAMRPVRM